MVLMNQEEREDGQRREKMSGQLKGVSISSQVQTRPKGAQHVRSSAMSTVYRRYTSSPFAAPRTRSELRDGALGLTVLISCTFLISSSFSAYDRGLRVYASKMRSRLAAEGSGAAGAQWLCLILRLYTFFPLPLAPSTSNNSILTRGTL